jgi:hypothetical protein
VLRRLQVFRYALSSCVLRVLRAWSLLLVLLLDTAAALALATFFPQTRLSTHARRRSHPTQRIAAIRKAH